MSLTARLQALTPRQRRLLPEAMAALAVSAVAVAVAPFQTIAAFSGRRRRQGAPSDEDALIADVAWAVRACARRAPWRAKCFEQGLAAQWMLRRRGVAAALHYGLSHDAEAGLLAHVWVRSGVKAVVGCENAADFTEMARFPGPDADGSSLQGQG